MIKFHPRPKKEENKDDKMIHDEASMGDYWYEKLIKKAKKDSGIESNDQSIKQIGQA